MAAYESFDNIHLDLSKETGKCRFAENGLGWKPADGGEPFTLDQTSIGAAQWSRAARGYEVKILHRNSGIIQLDGFAQEDFERLAKLFKNWYSVQLENKEHSLRGWNWGKAEFGKAELTFNVQNRPAFEVPYSEISNTNLAGRNEIVVEFPTTEDVKANGHKGDRPRKGKRAAAGKDQLVEMRFYVPGTTTQKEAEGDDAASDADEEEKNAASLFYDTLMEKAEIGDTAGDTIATFQEVLHLTPRGRFDIDMYDSSFRLRGKTYDYKIQYEAIKKFMFLPKPDDLHVMLCMGLDPPLRQGQTRYPFVIMQFKKDEEVALDLNLPEDVLKDKYNGTLQAHYEQPLHQVVAYIFKGLAGKSILSPAEEFQTHRQQYGIKCSIKASEGFLYCLKKAFIFVPKPATYIPYENTQSITFSRVGGAVSALSTFDITVVMKSGQGSSQQFSNINREDLKTLEDFFKLKGLRVKNEIDEDANLMAAALREEMMGSSDEEVVGPKADRGSADEDESSVDEDFRAESDSDVAEEYDSAHDSSGSGSAESDVDNEVGSEDDDDEDGDAEEKKQPPKKKKKSS